MTQPDEPTLIETAKHDQNAFGVLFDSYYPKITNYVLRRTGDIHATEDIVSVVFFKAWHALPAYEQRGITFSAWLYRIANNQVNDHFRHKKIIPLSLETLFEASGFEPPGDDDLEQTQIRLEEQWARHEDFVLVQHIILGMPIKYQEILTLRYFEKKQINEIADITGKRINTIKSLIHRGTDKLIREFNAQRGKES